MHNAIQHFRDNIARVRDLGGLYDALCHLTTSAIDCSDILRAQFVLAVSALDQYIHEITLLGMLEVYSNVRPQTDAFLRFRISMESAMLMVSIGSSGGISGFESEIRERHSYLAFQNPDKIADAIRLFSSISLWQQVSVRLTLPADDVKRKLRLIVDRRNKIAHEADLDPSYPGTRWPISKLDANNTVDYIETICEAIHIVVV